ncbi:hypothetical protein B0H11DRAFT_2224234 [Mycena galericulata]|nr:hypothetical protein B0H11DRAFT_2224234 [Mycena galericulata]
MPAASPLGLRTSLHMHTALCPTVWLGRPPPFIRLAVRSSAWLAEAPASPAVHPPGWLARLRRPPPFIRLAGLHGSGVPLRSSAFPHKQTLIAYIYFITGGGGPNGHVHSQGQGGLWIYPHCGRTHHNGYTHKWTYPP